MRGDGYSAILISPRSFSPKTIAKKSEVAFLDEFDDETVFCRETLGDDGDGFAFIAGGDIPDMDVGPLIIEEVMVLVFLNHGPHFFIVDGHLVNVVSCHRHL